MPFFFLSYEIELDWMIIQGRYSVVGAQPVMEVIAKDNNVTIMDHEKGSLVEEVVDDPMEIPRKISEDWKPQIIDELPEAFCGN